MHGPPQVTLPRPLRNNEREKSPENLHRFNRYADTNSSKYDEEKNRKNRTDDNITKYLEKPIAKYSDNKYLERQKSIEKQKVFDRSKSFEQFDIKTNRYYEYQDKDSFERYPEAERYDKYQEKTKTSKDDFRKMEKEKPVKYFEDDGFDENIRQVLINLIKYIGLICC